MASDTKITADDVKRLESSNSRTRAATRISRIYNEELQRVHTATDKNFGRLLVCQWLAGIIVAMVVSPLTWAGTQSSLHIHLLAAIFYGALLTALPIYLIRTRPGEVVTRHVVSVCQMLFSDLFIQISGGRIETHFHVFGSLALLAFYRDWRVLVSASAVVALTHGIRGLYWPESVYGVVTPEPWRFLEHVFWVTFEDVCLVLSIKNLLQETWRRAEHQTEVEQAKASVEGEVVIRTAQLKASEQVFRQLAETAPVGIFQTDPGGENLFMNSELPRILDCPKSELVHGQWMSLLDETSNAVPELWNSSVKARTEFAFEARIIGRSGRPIHLRTRGVPVSYESGEFSGYIGIVEDITDFKVTEEKLLLENELSTAFSGRRELDTVLPEVLKKICEIWHWDGALFRWLEHSVDHRNGNEKNGLRELRISGDQQNGRSDHKNGREVRSTFAAMWHVPAIGAEQMEPLRCQCAPLLTADGKLEPNGKFAAFLAIPVVSGFEHIGMLELVSCRVSLLDKKSVFLLQSLGRDLGDVITRHNAEKTIHAHEAMLQAIHDSVAEAIIAVDQNACVISANPAAERIFGGERSLLSSRNLWDLVPTHGNRNFDATLWENLWQELLTGVAQRWEGTGRRLNGETFPVEIVVSEAGDGGERLYVAVVRDISERKESERRVSEFYSIVSHELRTPLTSIRGSLGLISGGLTGEIPEDAMELLGIASESCDRLIRLINDILDLKKLESGKFVFRLERLIPREIVATALSQIEGMAQGRCVVLEHKINCDIPFIGDSDRIIQVLTNLLSNAIKFSPKDSCVRVIVSASQSGNYVRFQVIDFGPGIPPEHVGKLFGKFQQIDSSDTRLQEGTGLGLAISKSIIEQLEGRIGVSTIPGKGSTFWFELPVCEECTGESES